MGLRKTMNSLRTRSSGARKRSISCVSHWDMARWWQFRANSESPQLSYMLVTPRRNWGWCYCGSKKYPLVSQVTLQTMLMWLWTWGLKPHGDLRAFMGLEDDAMRPDLEPTTVITLLEQSPMVLHWRLSMRLCGLRRRTVVLCEQCLKCRFFVMS